MTKNSFVAEVTSKQDHPLHLDYMRLFLSHAPAAPRHNRAFDKIKSDGNTRCMGYQDRLLNVAAYIAGST